jgi:hypothetical protein
MPAGIRLEFYEFFMKQTFVTSAKAGKPANTMFVDGRAGTTSPARACRSAKRGGHDRVCPAWSSGNDCTATVRAPNGLDLGRPAGRLAPHGLTFFAAAL